MKLFAASKSLLKIAALLPVLALAACVETTSPVCDESNKIDVAGLDRTYNMSLMFDVSASPTDQALKIERKGKGTYSVGADDLATCKLGAWTIGESKTKFGTYSQNILSTDGEILNLTQLLVDPLALKAAGVAFDIVERPDTSSSNPVKTTVDHVRQMFATSAAPSTSGSSSFSKVLVIKNDSAASRDVLAQSAKPNGFSLSLH